MSAKVYDQFVVLMSAVGWVCDDCKDTVRSVHQQIKATTASLAEQLAEVKNDVEELKAAANVKSVMFTGIPDQKIQSPFSTENNANSNDTDKSMAMIVRRTIDDVERRKRNILVTGLAEGQSTADDVAAFLDICETHLPV